MIYPKFTQSVGVAPGTATMQLSAPGMWPPPATNPFPFPEESRFYLYDPWARYQGRRWMPDGQPCGALGEIPRARIRWDVIAVVGGGSLAIALAIGLIASALSK